MTTRCTVLAILLLLLAGDSSFGQGFGDRYRVLPMGGKIPRTDPAPAATADNKTRVHVEILTGRLGGGLEAQRWGRILRDVGAEGRIRQLRTTDELGVFETTRGPLRDVRVVGRLERDGTVRFADRRFRPADGAKLKEWIDELKTFGKQGAPEGQPVWGLSKVQFDILYKSLSKEVDPTAIGRPLRTSLGNLGLPPTLSIRVSEDARETFAAIPRDTPVDDRVAGASIGTGLALLLREHRLGVRPTRTPDGTIELTVVPLARTTDVWPVGWKFEGPRGKAMPKMFTFVPVRLDDSALTDVLAVIAEKTEVPIHVDTYGTSRAGIDVGELRTSFPAKRTTWSLLLRGVLGPHRLIREFRTDESGRVFCWVTVFVPRPGGRQDD